jgi:hypothetical protein
MSKLTISPLLGLTILVTVTVAAWLTFDVFRTVKALSAPLDAATISNLEAVAGAKPPARSAPRGATIPVVEPVQAVVTDIPEAPGIKPPRPPDVRRIDPRVIAVMQRAEAERLREELRNPQNDDSPGLTPEAVEASIRAGNIAW